jgi:hypothetical protein
MMRHLTAAARVFYDTTIDHHERVVRLEAALAEARGAAEREELEQYISDTQRSLAEGVERWASRGSPESVRDEAMRNAVQLAAAEIAPHPVRTSFLEELLQDALMSAWDLCSPAGDAVARAQRHVPGWEPQPGGTDLLLGLLGDPRPTIAAELKIFKVEETLWDLFKVAAIVERDPEILRGYLVVAAPPKRWRDAEAAELFAVREPVARNWDSRALFERWRQSWAYLLAGGRARPRDLPGRVRTTFLGAHQVRAFPDHELRCIAVEPLPKAPRLRFGDNGWPSPPEGALTCSRCATS